MSAMVDYCCLYTSSSERTCQLQPTPPNAQTLLARITTSSEHTLRKPKSLDFKMEARMHGERALHLHPSSVALPKRNISDDVSTDSGRSPVIACAVLRTCFMGTYLVAGDDAGTDLLDQGRHG